MNDTDHDLLQRIDERTAALAATVNSIADRMEEQYVLKTEFEPVKRIVFGAVWIVVTGVIVALLAIVIRKGAL